MTDKILQKSGAFLNGDGDTEELFASSNFLYGPWDSIDACEEWFSNKDADIPDGLVIAVKESGNMISLKQWIVPAQSSGYWKDISSNGNVICIAGILEDCTKKASTAAVDGNCDNVYYIKDDEGYGTLGLVLDENQATYYPLWLNYPEYGSLDGTNVLPYEGRVYVTKGGELLFGTSEGGSDVEPGQYDFDNNQMAAINSGITAQMVTILDSLIQAGINAEAVSELLKLKNMHIRYNSTTDTITLTDTSLSTPVTKKYNLVDNSTLEPMTPVVTISYGSSPIPYTGTTSLSPTISVTQQFKVDGVVDATRTIECDTLEELEAATDSNGIRFHYTTTGADDFDSLDPNTGEIITAANTGTDAITSNITLTVRMNGVEGSGNCAVIQSANTKYIQSISYPTVTLDNYSGGDITILPSQIDVVDSDGQTRKLDEYSELGNVESFTIAAVAATGTNVYSPTVSVSSDGTLVWNPATILSSITAEKGVVPLTIKVQQTGRADVTTRVHLFQYASYNNVSSMTKLSNYGGSTNSAGTATGFRTIKSSSGRYSITSSSITANAGDVIVLKVPTLGTWYWIWETDDVLTGTAAVTADAGFGVSDATDTIVYKVSQGGYISFGYMTSDTNKPTGYRIISSSSFSS